MVMILRSLFVKSLLIVLFVHFYGFAQGQGTSYLEKPVTIQVSNSTFAEIFEIISTQTNVVFSYTESFNDKAKTSIHCNQLPLNNVLKDLLKPLNIDFKIKGKYVIIGSALYTYTQTVRGNVIDKVSQEPLPGAVILLLCSEPLLGTTSNENGGFNLNQVAVGKQSLKVSFIGYKDAIVTNISVNSGKETNITVQLEEDITMMNEVLITANIQKNRPLNTMSVVSSRTFSVEETQKFAASFNDPTRMAASFAGVVGTGGDGNNFISVRGNSPNGLLWRMEGVEIPNPNHFSNVATSGGGVSILSSQVLGNSDFSTGAFAAEYGNALSGVFDLKLRKGNNHKCEFTVEAGFLGLNMAVEGPFSKSYDGSYLINYRYSTLSLLNKLGLPLGDVVTNFQDLSLNISLPTKRLGTFGIFGFGGLSYQDSEAEKDSLRWMEDSWYRFSDNFVSNTGALGFTNSKLFSNNSYLKTAIVLSGTRNGDTTFKLQDDFVTLNKEFFCDFNQSKVTFSTNYTQKLNARSSLRSGFIINQLGYSLEQRDKIDTTLMVTKIDNRGTTQTAQVFCQWSFRVNENITTNVGMHYLQLFLNNTQSVEPRISAKYDITPKDNISVGYGLHSQIQPLGNYFAQKTLADGLVIRPNEKLPFTKSHHFVLGYDRTINDHTHVKTELYYQYLFNVPVSKDVNDRYSILNNFNGYYTNELVNSGLGKNYGVELTLERFMFKDFYYIVSGSVYDSKYQASNKQWYNTMYNTNYNSSITLGKEWDISSGDKNRVFGFNLRSVYSGGSRYTPVDLQASMEKTESVLDQSKSYELQHNDYFRVDIRISLKRNFNKTTSVLALDVQNVTNQKGIGGETFDTNTRTVKSWSQGLIVPVLSYRVDF